MAASPREGLRKSDPRSAMILRPRWIGSCRGRWWRDPPIWLFKGSRTRKWPGEYFT